MGVRYLVETDCLWIGLSSIFLTHSYLQAEISTSIGMILLTWLFLPICTHKPGFWHIVSWPHVPHQESRLAAHWTTLCCSPISLRGGFWAEVAERTLEAFESHVSRAPTLIFRDDFFRVKSWLSHFLDRWPAGTSRRTFISSTLQRQISSNS